MRADLPFFRALPLAFLLLAAAHGHGDLHERIERLDARLRADPDNAALYAERAELHRQHDEPRLAEADLAAAEKRSPGSPAADLVRAKLALDRGKLSEARAALDRVLGATPAHREAREHRARLLPRLGETRAAAADLDWLIERADPPTPDHFLARSALADGPEETLRVLEAGIVRLGPAHPLQARAFELEVQLGRTDAALARLDALLRASGRKEGWLLRRADLLASAGRTAAARDAYAAVLREIEALPDLLRRRPSVQRLLAEARARADSLPSAP